MDSIFSLALEARTEWAHVRIARLLLEHAPSGGDARHRLCDELMHRATRAMQLARKAGEHCAADTRVSLLLQDIPLLVREWERGRAQRVARAVGASVRPMAAANLMPRRIHAR